MSDPCSLAVSFLWGSHGGGYTGVKAGWGETPARCRAYVGGCCLAQGAGRVSWHLPRRPKRPALGAGTPQLPPPTGPVSNKHAQTGTLNTNVTRKFNLFSTDFKGI